MNKLKQVQQAVGKLEKTATNPFFKSKYIDINGLLDVLNPALDEAGLTLLQPLTTVEGKPAVKTIIIDDGGTEFVNEAIIMPELQDPQKMGACITYYRRYALISLFALQAEDDDGNTASGKQSNMADGVPPVPDKKVPF